MKKEEIEQFSNKLPFRIITKDHSFYTIKFIDKITEESIIFRDKYNGLNIVCLNDISQVKEINAHSETANGGGSL